MRRYLCILAILLFAIGAAFSQSVNDTSAVVIAADRESAEIGDSISISIQLPPGEYDKIEPSLPKDQETFFQFDKELKRVAPGEYKTTIYPLTRGTEEGKPLEFGPLKFEVTPKGAASAISLESNKIALTIAGPAGESTEELADYTGLLELPFDYFARNVVIAAIVVVALLILVALVLLALVLMRRRARELAARPKYVIPPVDEALRIVRALMMGDLSLYRDKGAEAHYTALSIAIRRYFEDQYHLPATEMTEGEMANALRYQLANVPRTETLDEILNRMSMAKFARQSVTAEVAKDDCRSTESFLISEKERIERMRIEAAKNAATPTPTKERDAA